MMCSSINRAKRSGPSRFNDGGRLRMRKLRAASSKVIPDVLDLSAIQFADGCPGSGCGASERDFKTISAFHSKSSLQIEVMEFRESDFDSLVEMYDAFEPKRAAQGLPPVGRERIVAWLRNLQRNGHNLVALWDGQVIGHSILCPVDPQRAEFAIFLSQDFRNQGIGTGLAEVTLTYAQRKGLRHVWLSVEVSNQPAIRVYRKMGFQVCGHFGPEQEMDLDLEKLRRNEANVRESAA